MATIDSENAKQIRDPMQVSISLNIEVAGRITQFLPGTNKSYDSTLSNDSYSMRVLADLQDGGFLLDGSAEWYEEESPSSENGKLGLRGIAGENLTLRITANQSVVSLIVITQNAGRIQANGNTYQATGQDIIPMGSSAITLTFVPEEEHGRALVEFIMPGVRFNITNENLIKADINLRSSLDPFAKAVESSDMAVQIYYPNDISEVLATIGDDWAVKYSAGYSNEMAPERKFYLNQPVTWENNVISINAVDSSYRLANMTVSEAKLNSFASGYTGNADSLRDDTIFYLTRKYITDTTRVSITSDAPGVRGQALNGVCFNKECSLSELVQVLMALTASLPADCRISYVDAGRPKWCFGERNTPVRAVAEEDLSNITFSIPRKVAKIQPSTEELYDVNYARSNSKTPTQTDISEATKGQIIEASFDGGYAFMAYSMAYLQKTLTTEEGDIDFYDAQPGSASANIISYSPSRAVFKSVIDGYVGVLYVPLIGSGGFQSYSNSDGTPGEVVVYDSTFIGSSRWSQKGVDLLSPKNLLKVDRRAIMFSFKGDPRWQPRDFLTINRLDGSALKTRIESIAIHHEGGGTYAEVVAQYTDQY